MERELALLGDIILVKAESREKTPSGIVVPTQRQHPDHAERFFMVRYGTVLRTGPGRKSKRYHDVRIPMTVKEGDTVMFHDWIGTKRPDAGLRHAWDDESLFMHEVDLLGIVRPVA